MTDYNANPDLTSDLYSYDEPMVGPLDAPRSRLVGTRSTSPSSSWASPSPACW